MTKIFAHNYNNILNDVLSYYHQTTNLLEAAAYVTWNDLIQPQNKVIQLCKEHNKPTIVVEHGMKAVSDYQKDLRDIKVNMGGKPMIADKFCVWGQKSKDILLAADIPENKVELVGSPVIWVSEYLYKNKNKESRVVPFHAGIEVVDPNTKEKWSLEGCRKHVPQYEAGNIVVFFPGHRVDEFTLQKIQLVYDQIKHRSDVFVMLSENFLNDKEDNPFRDLLKMKDVQEQRTKCIAIPTNSPQNMNFIRCLLKKTKCAISVIPGTINGICWAMNVPIITPKIDFGWRDLDDKTIYDLHEADYICDEDKVSATLDGVLSKDTKADIRKSHAIDFMGIELGDPTSNIRKVIDETILHHSGKNL